MVISSLCMYGGSHFVVPQIENPLISSESYEDMIELKPGTKTSQTQPEPSRHKTSDSVEI